MSWELFLESLGGLKALWHIRKRAPPMLMTGSPPHSMHSALGDSSPGPGRPSELPHAYPNQGSRMFRVLATLPLLVPIATASQAPQLPPLQAVRACAENEPALGVLVTYPTALPFALLAEIAEDDVLYVMLDDPADRIDTMRDLDEKGVNLANVEFIMTPTDSIWTRDWSASAGFQNGQHTLVDPSFIAYTLDSNVGGSLVTLGGAHAADDASPAGVAAHTGVQHAPVPFHLVGGNYDADGLGNAFCTQLLVDENRFWGVSEGVLRGGLQQTLGIDDLRVLPNYATFDLQHIDCALKVVDEETLIITRPPATHPEFPFFEALAQKAASFRTAFGRRYKIHRIDAPLFDAGTFGPGPANYANSLILNGKVLIPTFGMPQADAEALQVYAEAMPGYEIIGFPYEDAPLMGNFWTWQVFDSVHCRTHQIFDPKMLLIKHPRVRKGTAGHPIQIRTLIHAYSGTPLMEKTLHWRVAGVQTWTTVPLTIGAHGQEFVAQIPGQAAGTQIEYYLTACDSSGRTESRPPLAPTGSYSFLIH